jgi:hypothetical protein
MRFIAAAIVALVALYFADDYFADGRYLRAATAIVSQIAKR